MVRATWPSCLKVIYPGGLDAALLREWRQRRPDGLLVLRRYFPDENLDPGKVEVALNAADQIADLHPVVEVPINEAHQTSPDEIARLAEYSVAFVEAAAASGFRSAVGVFSEGNPSDLAWWERFHPALRAARQHGGYLALHEYGIPSLGFEDWHLLRHRRVWEVLPEDCRVPILITESGIDGGIEGRREVGWRGYMSAPAYAGWLRTYHREIAQDAYVHASTLFLCGGYPQWASFDVTDEVDLRPPLTEDVAMPVRWSPSQEPTVPDWYPPAVRRPISVNYTPGRAITPVALLVHHIADGLGSPWAWFNTDRGQNGSSAHFWVSKTGTVEQYRPLGDTCWANGPVCRPDTTNPVVVAVTGRGQVNAQTVAVEHEGHPGDAMPAAQLAATRALTRWLADQHRLPYDRTHLVGHYQIDSCTRPNCPGPTHPWNAILGGTPVPDTDAALLDQLYALAGQIQALEQRWTAINCPHRAAYVSNEGEAIKEWVNAAKGQK